MSIDDGFKKMLEGVKLADEGRDEIMRGMEEAWEGQIKEQSTHIKEMRQRLNES
jgi:hypothetical protein